MNPVHEPVEVERLEAALRDAYAERDEQFARKAAALRERDDARRELAEARASVDFWKDGVAAAGRVADRRRAERDALRAVWNEWRARLGGSFPRAMVQEMDAALDAPETTKSDSKDQQTTQHTDTHGREWDRHPFIQGRFKAQGVCMCDQPPEHEIHAPETPGDADA